MAEDNPEPIPDIYCDSVQVAMTAYDVMLVLTKMMPKIEGGNLNATPSQVGLIRMSLEHAKIMSIIIRRNIQQYEEKTGSRIPMHPDVCKTLGISKEEDW